MSLEASSRKNKKARWLECHQAGRKGKTRGLVSAKVQTTEGLGGYGKESGICLTVMGDWQVEG